MITAWHRPVVQIFGPSPHRGLWGRVFTVRVDINFIIDFFYKLTTICWPNMCLKGILYCKIKTIKAFGSQKVIFGHFGLGIGHNPVNIHILGECLALSDLLPNFSKKSYTKPKIKLNFSTFYFLRIQKNLFWTKKC